MSSSTMTGLPLLYGRNLSQDLYSWALTAAYRTGWRLYDPDYALAQEPDIYEKIRRDPIIASAMEQRLHAIAGRRWSLEPNRAENDQDKQVAQIMEDLLGEISKFSEARYEMAMAVLIARTYGFIEGERTFNSYGDSTEVMEWFVPKRIKDVDRRRIRLVPTWGNDENGYRTLKNNRLELFSLVYERWLPLDNPEYWVRHVYNDEEARLGHGRGLLEAIYFYWYAKEIVLREGLQGLERWAQGLVTVKVDGMREADTNMPNSEVAEAWINVINEVRARHVIVADKEDEIEVTNMQGTGHQMVKDFLQYLDDAITRLLTGALLPSGGGETGGSYARAETEENTQEAVVQYDRALLDEVITRDLVGLVWHLNYHNFAQLGLGAARCPKFSTVQEKKQDPEVAASVAATLNGIGADIILEELYEATGYSVPAPGDEVLAGAQAPEPGLDPFGGGEEGFPFKANHFQAIVQREISRAFAKERRGTAPFVQSPTLPKSGIGLRSLGLNPSQKRDEIGRWSSDAGSVIPNHGETISMNIPTLGDVEAKYDSNLTSEARATANGIIVGPKFYELSEDDKLHVLAHEVGHELSDRMLEDLSAFDIMDSGANIGDFNGNKEPSLNGQTTPGEIVAEAYSVLLDEPEFLLEHYPKLYEIILDRASKEGFPVPTELTLSRSADLALNPSQQRCPDGSWTGPEDKNGCDTTGGVDAPAQRPFPEPVVSPATEDIASHPGAQLDPAILDRMKQLGVGKFPSHLATDLEIHDPFGEDVDDRAVMSWRSRKGKKQHAYTHQFHQNNAAEKWEKIQKLEPMMDGMKADLNRQVTEGEFGSPEHEGALIAAVIAETGLRPGNIASMANDKYGISTLLEGHLQFRYGIARLHYNGKSDKHNQGTVEAPELVEALQEYANRADGGPLFSASSLAMARAAPPTGVKLKDFRTIVATRVARQAFLDMEPPPPPLPEKGAKRLVASIIKKASTIVSDRLNNTPSVAKTSYIHPAVFEEFRRARGIPEELVYGKVS